MEQRKLLLADDSITIQKVVNLTFADEGIEVVAVGNGSLAVERLEEVKPDLVLADVHMPGLNGYEVCERVRQTPGFEQTPVMLLVGSFEPFDEAEAERAGANDYLTKPFQSIRQLISKVTALLDSPAVSSFANTAELEMPANIDSNSAAASTLTEMNYGESFASTSAQPEPQQPAFGDAGFADDEMIETSRANDFNRTNSFDLTNDFGQSFVREVDSQTSEKEDGRQTQPLSVSELKEFGASEETPATQAASSEEWEVVETREDFESASATEDYAMPVEPQASDELNAVPVQYIVTDEAGGETEKQTRQVTYDFTAASGFEPSDAAEESLSGGVGEENMSGLINASLLEFEGEKPPSLNLSDDDDSLLDIEDETEEIAEDYQKTAASSAVTPEVLAPENQQIQALQTQQTSMEKPTDAFGLSNTQFPPEVIDAIAQRVVEKLSDKVIEKIAWEIVPDRFDLIVRKQMQDKDRSR